MNTAWDDMMEDGRGCMSYGEGGEGGGSRRQKRVKVSIEDRKRVFVSGLKGELPISFHVI